MAVPRLWHKRTVLLLHVNPLVHQSIKASQRTAAVPAIISTLWWVVRRYFTSLELVRPVFPIEPFNISPPPCKADQSYDDGSRWAGYPLGVDFCEFQSFDDVLLLSSRSFDCILFLPVFSVPKVLCLHTHLLFKIKHFTCFLFGYKLWKPYNRRVFYLYLHKDFLTKHVGTCFPVKLMFLKCI